MAGRPVGSGTKEKAVKEYAEAHPEATVTEIAKAVGVSRTTVYKYGVSGTTANQQHTAGASDHDIDGYEQMRKQKLREYMKNLFEEDV